MSDSRRVLLKLSGEAFADPEIGYGIDPTTVIRIAAEIAAAHANGTEMAVVVGGGNTSGVSLKRPREWTPHPPTTWGCWQQ